MSLDVERSSEDMDRVTDSTKVASQRCLNTAPTSSWTPTEPRAGEGSLAAGDVEFFLDEDLEEEGAEVSRDLDKRMISCCAATQKTAMGAGSNMETLARRSKSNWRQ